MKDQGRITDKLESEPNRGLAVANEDCIWHPGNVTCNKWIKVFDVDDQTPTSGWAGWVRSKYIQPVAAESC